MSISVYTTTLGNRNFYLQKLFHFLDSHHDEILEWHIGIQGSDNDLGIPDKPWINYIDGILIVVQVKLITD